jgi:hypothetical protein
MHEARRTRILVRTLALASLGAAACVGAKVPIEKYSKKVVAYFDAKKEFADTLQMQLGGTTGNDSYRLIPITGPAYPVGALVSMENPLDLESRACVLSNAQLPVAEPWAELPNWASNSNLDLGLGIPAFFKRLFGQAETTLDAGLKLQSESQFQISHISQVFLSRSQLRQTLASPACQAALADVPGGSVIFIRGLVYGQETLKSAKGFGLGVKGSVGAGDGQFSLKYDSAGAFELTETAPAPKFAIVAKIALAPASAGPAGDRVLRPGKSGAKDEALVFAPPSAAELAAINTKLNQRSQ